MPTVFEALVTALERHQVGDLQAAEQIYHQILAADPNHADALHLLGVKKSQEGSHELAVDYIRRAIHQNGSESLFHCNLGAALKACGKMDEAIACFCRALELNPDHAEAHYNLGATLQLLGKLDDAAPCLRRALELKPDYVEARVNLGNVFQAQDKLDEAIDCYLRALEQKPDFAVAHFNLGNALQARGDLNEAVGSYRRALDLEPHFTETHYNLGNALQALGKLDEAVDSYRRALELNPDHADAHTNLGATFQFQGNLEAASDCYRKALALKPNYAQAHSNQAMLWLLRGDFQRGWIEYEWRGKSKPSGVREFSQPAWDGNPLNERTILVHAEQGFGDTFQFIRFVALLKKQNAAATVIVRCQRPLKKLLAGCPGADHLIPEGDDLPPFDIHSRLLSLPGVFRTTTDTVPTGVPYLFADPALVVHWRDRLTNVNGLRIGINWQGRAGQGEFRKRDIPLKHFAALTQLPGVSLVSLQKGQASDELVDASERQSILNLGPEFDDTHGPFMDTAAVMSNLDLVISSDTAVPHLAGALGVPVWVALPMVPDWRWLLDRADSPWYRTMRLFRQKSPNDWNSVFDEILTALRNFTPAPR